MALDDPSEDVPVTADTVDAPADRSSSTPDPDLPTVGELQARIDDRDRRIAEINDRYLRAHAEFENYKKRLARDQTDIARYAHETLLRELLPVLDNLERALQHLQGMPAPDQWAEGVALTQRQLLDTLVKFGVAAIPAVGTPFDPTVHQAVAQKVTSDAPSDTVIEEFQKGYRLHDRVLRPAMVVVSQNQTGGAETSTADTVSPERS